MSLREASEMAVQSTEMDYTVNGGDETVDAKTKQLSLEAEISSLRDSVRALESLFRESGLDPRAQNFPKPEPVKASKSPKEARVCFIENKYDRIKGRRVDNEVEDFIDGVISDTHFSITARKIFNNDNMTIDRTEIIIRNQGLLALLREVLSPYLKHEFQALFEKKELLLSNPFIPIVYNWEELQAATTNADLLRKYGSGDVGDLKQVLDLVERIVPDITGSWNNILLSKSVMQKYLFTMFKPGNIVITRPQGDHLQLMKVHHYGAGSTYNPNGTSSVFCEGYDWNGERLERLRYEFPMPKIDHSELIAIRDLPCYPLEMYEDEQGVRSDKALRKRLIERGRKFETLCFSQDKVRSRYQYEGQFQAEGDLRSGLMLTNLELEMLETLGTRRSKIAHLRQPAMSGRNVVIDFRSFREHGPREARNGLLSPQTRATLCNCSLCMSEESKEWMTEFGKQGEKKDRIEYAMLPPRALGFSLNDMLWGQFLINGINEIGAEDVDHTFDNELIFPEGKEDAIKKTVKALIMNHKMQPSSQITDPISGKGQGLILLFHGPPGVGKTMTAEALAKSCRKPLLTVGIGDLGTAAEKVEKSLNKLFEVVTAWHGILLIDEADVLLDSRGSKGEVFPQQNALVSVMLRLLEYFTGILILTTNRVKSIDYAMMSRISYAIKFQTLRPENQKLICNNYIAQASQKQGIKAGEKPGLEAVVNRFRPQDNLNGREIRTLFTTAQLLGGGKLTAQNVDDIHEQQQSFIHDMKTEYIKAEHSAVVQ